MRGHKLGRTIYQGAALKNTGVPGVIKGYGKERVIHSPNAGTVKHVRHLTDIVKKGEVIAYVDQTPIYATMDGLLRGLIKEGFVVTQGFKWQILIHVKMNMKIVLLFPIKHAALLVESLRQSFI